MTDYFFISSPLHLFVSANIALQNPEHERVAVIIAKSVDAGDRYRSAAAQNTAIFERVLPLSADVAGRHCRYAPLFRRLKAEFLNATEARLFTGNDRRVEFQYAMHVAARAGGRVEGIYMDEGAVTYAGHKSMHRLGHRYLAPMFKKLLYGFWYRNAVTTGTSAWIDRAVVAFPNLVHPLLQHTPRTAIYPAPFKTQAFAKLARSLLGDNETYPELLRNTRCVITLPHEAGYIHHPETYAETSRRLRSHFDPSEMAVKPHPRITNRAIIETMFPDTPLLEPTVGMEALVALLPDDCLVVGDISSTLLTTRWLRPALAVVALSARGTSPTSLDRLYEALDIPRIAPADLDRWLAETIRPAVAPADATDDASKP